MKTKFIRFLNWLGLPFGLSPAAKEGIALMNERMKSREFQFGPLPQADTVLSFTNQELIDILKLEYYPPETNLWEKAGKELDRRLTSADPAKSNC